jgi:hypothetical protein
MNMAGIVDVGEGGVAASSKICSGGSCTLLACAVETKACVCRSLSLATISLATSIFSSCGGMMRSCKGRVDLLASPEAAAWAGWG